MLFLVIDSLHLQTATIVIGAVLWETAKGIMNQRFYCNALEEGNEIKSSFQSLEKELIGANHACNPDRSSSRDQFKKIGCLRECACCRRRRRRRQFRIGMF
jgi:hypothetical protein